MLLWSWQGSGIPIFFLKNISHTPHSIKSPWNLPKSVSIFLIIKSHLGIMSFSIFFGIVSLRGFIEKKSIFMTVLCFMTHNARQKFTFFSVRLSSTRWKKELAENINPKTHNTSSNCIFFSGAPGSFSCCYSSSILFFIVLGCCKETERRCRQKQTRRGMSFVYNINIQKFLISKKSVKRNS